MVFFKIEGSFDTTVIVQRMFTGVNSFPLMAIPFFMLAGSLMELGGISRRIIKFTDSLVGHFPGGLAVAGVFACMIFAAISGSAVATVAAIGGLVIPEMTQRKYPLNFSTPIITAAGTMGPIIPPSTMFVIYASIAGVSISDMFKGGYLPGILMGVSLAVYTVFRAKKLNLPMREHVASGEILKSLKDATLALLTPMIIVISIFWGIATPTEAGAVACVYAFILGKFIFKELDFAQIKRVLKEAAISSSIIMFLIGTANIFSWILTVQGIPQLVKETFMAVTDSKYVMLFMINILLLIVGMFLDSSPSLMMLVPVLAPLVKAYGINLVHFGVMMCLNLCIGLLTPPVGTCLFVGCRISGLRLLDLFKSIVVPLIILILVLFAVTYIPWLVTFPISISK
jgi:C4-dicarboxylate transporter DctM subunit